MDSESETETETETHMDTNSTTTTMTNSKSKSETMTETQATAADQRRLKRARTDSAAAPTTAASSNSTNSNGGSASAKTTSQPRRSLKDGLAKGTAKTTKTASPSKETPPPTSAARKPKTSRTTAVAAADAEDSAISGGSDDDDAQNDNIDVDDDDDDDSVDEDDMGVNNVDSQDQDDQDDDDDDDHSSDSESEDDACDICSRVTTPANNLIVFCDGKGCNIPVHQKCYGIDVVPPGDESWFCQRCQDGVSIAKSTIICCSTRSGALKRTKTPKQYIHAVCAIWNLSIDATKEPISVDRWLLDNNSKDKKCVFCDDTKGLLVKCSSDTDCKKWMHVTCAIQDGTIVRQPPRTVAKSSVICPEHSNHAKGRSNASSAGNSSTNKRVQRTSLISASKDTTKTKLKRRRSTEDENASWGVENSEIEADDGDRQSSSSSYRSDADVDMISVTPQRISDSKADQPNKYRSVSASKSPGAQDAGGSGDNSSNDNNTGSEDTKKPHYGASKKADRQPDSGSSSSSGSGGLSGKSSSSPSTTAPVTASQQQYLQKTSSQASLDSQYTADASSMSKRPSDPSLQSAFARVPGARPTNQTPNAKVAPRTKPWTKESSQRTSSGANEMTGFSSATKNARPGANPNASGSSTMSSAWSWIMEKMSVIKTASADIENMPSELKRQLEKDGEGAGTGTGATNSASGPSSQTASVGTSTASSTMQPSSNTVSPLESLMDSSYTNLSKIAEERSGQIRLLRQQLQMAQIEIQRLQQENARIRQLGQVPQGLEPSTSVAAMTISNDAATNHSDAATATSASSTTIQQYHTLQENLEVVFGFLGLPQMPRPSRTDIDNYVGVLRNIIDRCKRNSNSFNSDTHHLDMTAASVAVVKDSGHGNSVGGMSNMMTMAMAMPVDMN